jgi:hypothetical protein
LLSPWQIAATNSSQIVAIQSGVRRNPYNLQLEITE